MILITPKKPDYFKRSLWREYSGPEGFYWGKNFYPKHLCVHNQKVSVCIKPSQLRHDYYEFDLYGGLPDDTWVQLKNYACTIPEGNLEEKIPTIVNRLLTAWEALHN